jgi:hypothetical protein
MLLLFFEKFDLAAHPDPGRAINARTSECRWRGGLETGRPDFILVAGSLEWRILWRLAAKGSSRPHHSSTRLAGCEKLEFRRKRTEPRDTKKKGGAMNAPPLKGSDTSVSSPKRQTAEAVRI